MSSRPQSLKEVAIRALAGAPVDYALANFLDEFYARPAFEKLREEPPLTGVRITDCYLAATAAQLGTEFYEQTPVWAAKPERHLDAPHFAFRSPIGRAYALICTPAAFRERNLFIGEDALRRA